MRGWLGDPVNAHARPHLAEGMNMDTDTAGDNSSGNCENGDHDSASYDSASSNDNGIRENRDDSDSSGGSEETEEFFKPLISGGNDRSRDERESTRDLNFEKHKQRHRQTQVSDKFTYNTLIEVLGKGGQMCVTKSIFYFVSNLFPPVLNVTFNQFV